MVDANAGPQSLTEMHKKEIAETEAEFGIDKQQFVCVVHKGPIAADNIYLCPECHTFYCTKCARALREKGEKCWYCDNEITISISKPETSTTQEKNKDK